MSDGNIITFEENNRSRRELSIDLHRLLDHPNQFSDAVLKCGGVEIPVHKCILSARSPVFCAMFGSDMQEGQSGEVNIVDIELDVLQIMLKYLYSGNTGRLPDKIAEGLLAAADKYGLKDLKRICTNKLKSILSVGNVSNILVLGYLYDIGLKVHAKEFICKCKFSDLEDTEGWVLLEEEYPHLAMEVMKAIAKQDSSQQREKKTYNIEIHYDDRNISLDVKATDTVQDVKKKIEEVQGIVSFKQDLYGWTQLQDSRTLSDYNIQEQSTLYLCHKMQIFVKTLTGKEIPLLVGNRITTEELKKMLEDIEGIPVRDHFIVFGGEQLLDQKSLSSYNITDMSSVHMVLSLRG